MQEPAPLTALARGLRRRCGRCGAEGIFASWFRLRERCPRCGYRFEREEGAFSGVMLLNVSATFVLMFVSLVSYVVWRGVSGGDVPLAPFAVTCLVAAAVTPVAFYPFAAAGWAALDLAMRPLDDRERADARCHENS